MRKFGMLQISLANLLLWLSWLGEIEVAIVIYTCSGWFVGNLVVIWYTFLVNIDGLLRESGCVLLIVCDLGFVELSSHSELLGMILVVVLFVSGCYILSVEQDSALAMFVVILLLAKLFFVVNEM